MFYLFANYFLSFGLKKVLLLSWDDGVIKHPALVSLAHVCARAAACSLGRGSGFACAPPVRLCTNLVWHLFSLAPDSLCLHAFLTRRTTSVLNHSTPGEHVITGTTLVNSGGRVQCHQVEADGLGAAMAAQAGLCHPLKPDGGHPRCIESQHPAQQPPRSRWSSSPHTAPTAASTRLLTPTRESTTEGPLSLRASWLSPGQTCEPPPPDLAPLIPPRWRSPRRVFSAC